MNITFVLRILACVVILWTAAVSANSDVTPSVPPTNFSALTFHFSPTAEDLGPIYQGYSSEINVTFPLCAKNYTSFSTSVDVQRVLTVEVVILPPGDGQPCYRANVKLFGKTVGSAKITLHVIYKNPDENNPCQKELSIDTDYPVAVPRAPKIELKIFEYGTVFFLIILNLGFGCNLNLDIVKAILRRPIAPAVGFTCQYLLMPLVGFSVAKTLLKENSLLGFGMLCSSTAPGGAGSNVWCLLLGGDVDLSLTMTFFSLSASMFMMPLWLFLLGRFFVDADMAMPYFDIIGSLVVFVVPCFIGILIRKFSPRGAAILGKIIKPWSLIFIIFLLTFGLYVNRYIYPIIGAQPFILFPALLQPYLGFIFAFTIAKQLAKQPKYRCITIAIETGVQNVAIPMIMLQNSFPQPFGDVAAVMPVATAHFTPLPMLFTFIGLTIYKKFIKKKSDDSEDDPEADVEMKEPLENGTIIEVADKLQDTSLMSAKKSKAKKTDKKALADPEQLESFIKEKVHEIIMKSLDKESDL